MLGRAATVFVLTFLVDLVFVEAEAVVPSDTEAAVGDNAKLYCSSSLGRCEWHHRPVGTHGHEIVFLQGYIFNGYRGRFSVLETNNACNLQIESISVEDAGLFTCMETSTQEANKTAELIVFEQPPSDKTCAAKITCAPTCNDLELSCAMKSYGNLHPIMEWSDGDGKQMNSTLSEDKTTSTVHLKEVALQSLNYVCQVKYPSKSLLSKFVWSFSMPEAISPVVASTTEQPEQTKTVSVNVFAAVIVVVVVSIVALVSANAIFLLCMKRNKRKSTKLGGDPDITEKKMVNDKTLISTNERNCRLIETTSLYTEMDTMLQHGIGHLDIAASVPSFTETRSNAIFALAVLDSEVFVVTKDKNNVEVFDLQSKNWKRQWEVNGLIDPNDMVACPNTKLIFICDWKNCLGEEEIFCLDKTGMLHYRWHCEGERGRISVTKECSLLIADGKKSVIYEYKFNGQLIRTTHLKEPNLTMCHAIKLESGNFVASFEDEISECHEITMFDSSGGILESVKNDPDYVSPQSFSTPESLAVDSKGSIYMSCVGGDDPTAPCNNKIVSFTPQLEWKENIPAMIQEAGHNLSGPLRICLCESDGYGLLLVHGNIRVFNLKP